MLVSNLEFEIVRKLSSEFEIIANHFVAFMFSYGTVVYASPQTKNFAEHV